MILRRLVERLAATTALLLMSLLSVIGVAGQQSPLDTATDNRETEIEQLRLMIWDKHIQERNPEQVDRAIRRLGDLKAVEAINDLIELLVFRWPDEIRRGVGTHYGDGYIAKSALFQIGKPALPALARVIRDKDIESIEFKNARDTIMNIFREDLPGGAKYLRAQAATIALSSLERQRLSAAANWIDELKAKINAETAKPK